MLMFDAMLFFSTFKTCLNGHICKDNKQMWLFPSGWNKTSWQHLFFMWLFCANRFFIWVNIICKWGFFPPHVV